jgi:hypothetical protein
LEAVLDYAVLRLDGGILLKPGYDKDSGLLLHAGELRFQVPDNPSRDDAIRARDKLLEVVEDFPFEKPVHRGAWMAALLTPLARFAFAGPTPLFLADANVRASGKGLLLNVIAKIITGQRFTIATYTDDENELRKRITALAVGGDRLVLFDNVVGNLGNGVLDAALTADSWSDRLLGMNKMYHGPLYCTWYATGNNVAISGDTPRRCCPIRLESSLERPEDRGDFRHPNLLAWVGEKRSELLSAALTILRAYCAAGKPDQNLPAWGSFEGWSALVRSAVVWVGLPDPREACLLLQNQADVAAQHMHVLLDCWEKMDPERKGLTAAEVIAMIYPKQPVASPPAPHADLKSVLDAMLTKPDSRSLGNTLAHYRRRIFGERYIDHAGKRQGAVRWAVFPAVGFKPYADETHQTPKTHLEPGSQGESSESSESTPCEAAGDSDAQDEGSWDCTGDDSPEWMNEDYGPYGEGF